METSNLWAYAMEFRRIGEGRALHRAECSMLRAAWRKDGDKFDKRCPRVKGCDYAMRALKANPECWLLHFWSELHAGDPCGCGRTSSSGILLYRQCKHCMKVVVGERNAEGDGGGAAPDGEGGEGAAEKPGDAADNKQGTSSGSGSGYGVRGAHGGAHGESRAAERGKAARQVQTFVESP